MLARVRVGQRASLVYAIAPLVVALSAPVIVPAAQPTMMPWDAPLAELWQQPRDLADRDLFYGPWGAERAPDPNAVYTFVRPKQGGTNPGVIVRDPLGREWHVKQPSRNGQGDEGPAEVVVSRVLSAVGYHQPPVYYLPSFTMTDRSGTRLVRGGRFRLHDGTMRSRGEWSWRRNPFVGMRPHQGLLVILLTFSSFDFKTSNNTLYEVRSADHHVEQWYVVRDLGGALGETGWVRPKRNNPDVFERQRFIVGVHDGFVVFSNHTRHQDAIRGLTPADVGWASELLSRLSDRQWHDAFRAGGYAPAAADRFIRKLRANIAQAQQVAGDDWRPAPSR
jgi:hypothetical protein